MNIYELMKEFSVPGLSLAIIEEAKVVRHEHFGVENTKTQKPVSDSTLFQAASLSKPIFAYAVLQMIEEGILELDAPLTSYLPFHALEDDERLNLITARMALAHSSGLPNYSLEKKTLKIDFHPGDRFGYSGEGYHYLQKVVEHLTGQSLEEFMIQRVFKPLNMTHSSFVWASDKKLKSAGHVREGVLLQGSDYEPENAAFTLHTTAFDYAKFVLACLLQKRPEMLSPQIKINDKLFWGLGWGLQKTEDGFYFWQWGDNVGFQSYAAGCPETKKGIVILTNSSNGLKLIPKLIPDLLGSHHPAFEWLKK